MMKRTYEKPIATIAKMSFEEHILAYGDTSCVSKWVDVGDLECESGNQHLESLN